MIGKKASMNNIISNSNNKEKKNSDNLNNHDSNGTVNLHKGSINFGSQAGEQEQLQPRERNNTGFDEGKMPSNIAIEKVYSQENSIRSNDDEDAADVDINVDNNSDADDDQLANVTTIVGEIDVNKMAEDDNIDDIEDDKIVAAFNVEDNNDALAMEVETEKADNFQDNLSNQVYIAENVVMDDIVKDMDTKTAGIV